MPSAAADRRSPDLAQQPILEIHPKLRGTGVQFHPKLQGHQQEACLDRRAEGLHPTNGRIHSLAYTTLVQHQELRACTQQSTPSKMASNEMTSRKNLGASSPRHS